MSFASDHSVTGIEAAKRAVGGRAKDLAKAIGRTPALVSKWKGTIPEEWLFKVERATGVPHYILRPDLFARSAEPSRKRTRKAAA